MLFSTYSVVQAKDILGIGEAITTLNKIEIVVESDLIKKGTEPTMKRWKPCGPINYCNGLWVLPIVRNEI